MSENQGPGQPGSGEVPPGLRFEAASIPALLIRLLATSASAEVLQRLRTFRQDTKVVRQKLAEAVVEIGAATEEQASGAGIITLLGAILDHWQALAQGKNGKARG